MSATQPWPAGEWVPCYTTSTKKKAVAFRAAAEAAGMPVRGGEEKQRGRYTFHTPSDPASFRRVCVWMREAGYYRPAAG